MKNLIYLLTLLLVTSTFAQNKKEEDLKVGLVLSGGGAKGLAHIGALKVIEDSEADLVILDVNLPIMDGIEICKLLRETSSMPVIMLTAR